MTGATASLLITTVGDVVSASTQFSSAPPPASSASSASRSAGSPTMPVRHPADRVPVALLRAVHGRVRDREVVEVAGDVPPAIIGDSGVVGLRQRDDVLDIRRGSAIGSDVEREARVRRVDLASGSHGRRQRRDDVVLEAPVPRPEGVAVVAIPGLLLADLEAAPDLRIQQRPEMAGNDGLRRRRSGARPHPDGPGARHRAHGAEGRRDGPRTRQAAPRTPPRCSTPCRATNGGRGGSSRRETSPTTRSRPTRRPTGRKTCCASSGTKAGGKTP